MAISNTARALSFAFEQIFDVPPEPDRSFFLRAEPLEGLARNWQRGCLNVQSSKPIHDRLQKDGCPVAADLNGTDFDLGLLAITKHKQENLANLARSWMALRPGGRLMCVGANDIGISSIEKAFKALFDQPRSLSKHHCKVLWGVRGDTRPDILTDWAEAGRLQIVPSLGCWSQPGLYNWNKIDAGSALLVQNLPDDLHGRAADLGAGWGYLSQQLLGRGRKITSIDLFEAEELALDAAKANLESHAATATLRFHWHDVAEGLPPAAFDLVVMNPPFHDGKAVDIELGRAFITSAAQGLVPGGRLFLVANRQLPYEESLTASFSAQTMLAENGVYKVLAAVK
jgi:16S rRNA (guanine1207-N2)-methyltransferase